MFLQISCKFTLIAFVCLFSTVGFMNGVNKAQLGNRHLSALIAVLRQKYVLLETKFECYLPKNIPQEIVFSFYEDVQKGNGWIY